MPDQKVVLNRVLLKILCQPTEFTGIREVRKLAFSQGSPMNSLSQHYRQLVGLNQNWMTEDDQLEVQKRTLTLTLELVGDCMVR